VIDLEKLMDVLSNTVIKDFAVKGIFSSVNAPYKTMQRIRCWQLEGRIISQRDGFMKPVVDVQYRNHVTKQVLITVLCLFDVDSWHLTLKRLSPVASLHVTARAYRAVINLNSMLLQ